MKTEQESSIKVTYDCIPCAIGSLITLFNKGLVKNYTFQPRGYVYYIRNGLGTVRIENTFLIGDAVGLATRDMGEGIGPAVQSGILAARSIVEAIPFSLSKIKKNSFSRYGMLLKLMGSWFTN